MRDFMIFLLSAAIAMPAAAQYNTNKNNTTAAPAATATTTTSATNSAATPQNGEPSGVNISIQPAGKETDPAGKEEVGYDAKVKRDPYGKVIKDHKKGAAEAENPVLRNDKKLPSDADFLKKP